MITDNPERHIIDIIDALVDESLDHGPTDDYDAPYAETCHVCRREWHGIPQYGCPGAYATKEQVKRYRGPKFSTSIPSVQDGPVASVVHYMECRR